MQSARLQCDAIAYVGAADARTAIAPTSERESESFAVTW
jgi:hypothetical protein